MVLTIRRLDENQGNTNLPSQMADQNVLKGNPKVLQEWIKHIPVNCQEFYSTLIQRISKPPKQSSVMGAIAKRFFNYPCAKLRHTPDEGVSKKRIEEFERDSKLPALHFVTKYTNPEAIRSLVTPETLQERAPVKIGDKIEYLTAIEMAVKCNHLEALQTLLDAGANVNMIDKNGNSLLHLAAESGRLDITSYLLNRVSPQTIDRRNHDEATSLSLAYKNNHSAIAALLEQAGARISSNLPEEHIAEMKKHLIELKKDNRTKFYRLSNTHLLGAVGYGDIRVLRMLIGVGADLTVTNSEGDTLLHLAAKNGDTKSVEILMTTGLTPDTPNQHGHTPIHYAVAGEFFDAFELLAKRDQS